MGNSGPAAEQKMTAAPAPGPTPERLRQSEGHFDIGGDKRVGQRFKMRDTPLGRALVRQKISEAEYAGLKKYALHWFAGGLAGHLNSVDLNRVLAFDPMAMTGLARSEAQLDHRKEYNEARAYLGIRQSREGAGLVLVADCVACWEVSLEHAGHLLGFVSPYRAREAAASALRAAGDQLVKLWTERAR
jgi:hypothetical protein